MASRRAFACEGEGGFVSCFICFCDLAGFRLLPSAILRVALAGERTMNTWLRKPLGQVLGGQLRILNAVPGPTDRWWQMEGEEA